MKLKIKTLCGLKKGALKDNFIEIQRLVAHPRYICGKCARAAHESSILCKPVKIES